MNSRQYLGLVLVVAIAGFVGGGVSSRLFSPGEVFVQEKTAKHSKEGSEPIGAYWTKLIAAAKDEKAESSDPKVIKELDSKIEGLERDANEAMKASKEKRELYTTAVHLVDNNGALCGLLRAVDGNPVFALWEEDSQGESVAFRVCPDSLRISTLVKQDDEGSSDYIEGGSLTLDYDGIRIYGKDVRMSLSPDYLSMSDHKKNNTAWLDMDGFRFDNLDRSVLLSTGTDETDEDGSGGMMFRMEEESGHIFQLSLSEDNGGMIILLNPLGNNIALMSPPDDGANVYIYGQGKRGALGLTTGTEGKARVALYDKSKEARAVLGAEDLKDSKTSTVNKRGACSLVFFDRYGNVIRQLP